MHSTDPNGSIRPIARRVAVAAFLVLLLATVAAAGTASAETATVNGTVTDEDGDPIANATVSVSGERTESDADGRFELEAPFDRQGTATVVVRAPGYHPEFEGITSRNEYTRTVSVELAVDPDHRIYQNATVSGTVRGPDRSPVAGATVVVTEVGGDRRFVNRTVSAEDGRYQLGVPDGNYTLVASYARYANATKSVSLEPGRSHLEDLRFAAIRGFVEGTVVDTAGDPVPNATVVDDDARAATTDASGAYRLSTDPGEGVLEARAEGFDSATLTVAVDSNATIERRIVLESAADNESESSPGNETDDEPVPDESANESTAAQPVDVAPTPDAPEDGDGASTASTPGYRQLMSLLGVFAGVLLTMAGVAVYRS